MVDAVTQFDTSSSKYLSPSRITTKHPILVSNSLAEDRYYRSGSVGACLDNNFSGSKKLARYILSNTPAVKLHTNQAEEKYDFVRDLAHRGSSDSETI